MFGHDRRPHSVRWRLDRSHMQHGKEPTLIASFNRRRPRIGSRRFWVPGEVKDLDYAFPDCRAGMDFLYRHGLDEGRLTAMLVLHGGPQLIINVSAHRPHTFTAKSAK